MPLQQNIQISPPPEKNPKTKQSKTDRCVNKTNSGSFRIGSKVYTYDLCLSLLLSKNGKVFPCLSQDAE